MNRTLMVILAALALAGCASAPTPAAQDLRTGDPAMLNRDCKLLGTVKGRGLFGGSDNVRTERAMTDAKDKAAALGATHYLVMDVEASGLMSTGQATLRAYRCGGTL